MNFNFSNKKLDNNSDSQTPKGTFQFTFKKQEANSQSKPETTTSESQKKPQFTFQFTKTTNTSSSPETKANSGFKFQFPSTTNSTTTTNTSSSPETKANSGFKFQFPSTTNSATTANTSSTPETKANSGFKFQFSSNTNSATTNESQPVKTAFNFNLNLNSKNKLSFNFGTGKEFQAEEKKFDNLTFSNISNSFSPKIKPQPQAPPAQEQQESNEDKIENAFCQSDKTGEEDEENLLNVKAILYAYVKPEDKKENSDEKKDEKPEKPGYRERGVGELHFNYNKEQNFYRLIMRRKEIKNIVLNQRVFPGMNPQKSGKNAMRFLGQINVVKVKPKDKDQDKDDTPKIDVLLLRFKDEETTDKLISLIQKAICEIKE